MDLIVKVIKWNVQGWAAQQEKSDRVDLVPGFSNDEFKVLSTLKKWGILSEKQISELAKLSHRRSIQSLERLEQERHVKVVESRRSEKTYRVTGSGLDHLERMRQGGRGDSRGAERWWEQRNMRP